MLEFYSTKCTLSMFKPILVDFLLICNVADSAFKQQRLTAWQPILTAGTVLPTFFVIGILFIPVGIGLWFFSENVKEITIAYTHCISTKENRTCADILKENSSAVCHCEVPFTLDTQFSVSPVVLFS